MRSASTASLDFEAWLDSHDSPEHDPIWLDSTWRAAVRRDLLRWFRRESRDLPWRVDSTPYRVWVSEIMLQQTQVATVIDYYHRFMKSFPTVRDLADASEQTVLSHWEGLGYYRRARSLHAAARKVVDEHEGEFPQTYPEVLALPGVGRYTAGAILSIACGQRLPILEGNTQRVFSRWVANRSPVTERSSTDLLWKIAESMLPSRNAGAFNQAAMELGALICRPASPDCSSCPVSKYCKASSLGLQEVIPGKVKQLKYENRKEYAFVIPSLERSGDGKEARYLIRSLPEGGRWAGLWDFPRTTEQNYGNVGDASQALSDEAGLRLEVKKKLLTIQHAVTRFRIKLNVYSAKCELPRNSGLKISQPWRLATLREMKDLPMSVTGRKIADYLAKGSSGRP